MDDQKKRISIDESVVAGLAPEYNTRMISARIEEGLYKKIKEMNMSVRELLWKGVRSVESHEMDIKAIREEIRDLRGNYKVVVGQVQMLARMTDKLLETSVHTETKKYIVMNTPPGPVPLPSELDSLIKDATD